MKSAHKDVLKQLEVLLKHGKIRKLSNYNLILLPWLILFILCCLHFLSALWTTFVIALLLLIIAQLIFRRLAGYQALTVANLVAHLNSQFPELENSAQLLLPPSKPWELLQVLQKKKVVGVLKPILQRPAGQLLPGMNLRWVAIHSLLVATLGLAGLFLVQMPVRTTAIQETILDRSGEIRLLSSSVTVIPPQYTKNPETESERLDISLIAGSKVEWLITFSDQQSDYYLQLADGSKHEFVRSNSGEYSLSKTIGYSGVYHLGTNSGKLDGLYTLSVTPDRPPSITIQQPQRTITEIPKNGQPVLLTKVKIEDDFAVNKVDIQASIAKGSGEAVKFRDQLFSFDQVQQDGKAAIYSKIWDLAKLGMEPGDELYFTIRAWDNRQPEQQLTRSQTKIVRWLEEEQEGILSDGLLIDFMPEYFKSQRQIIIETIELIEARPTLGKVDFDKTSRGLGIAQSDLKQKYGQYLGDEFDHGVVQQMEDGLGLPEIVIHDSEHGDTGHGEEAHSGDDHDEHDEHENEEHESIDRGGHEPHAHHHEEENSTVEDKSGAAQMIAKFGHAHGDTDIGIISQYNPKAMMKRSIANMWQAELHLMLSEPELALPYENEALKYLNLAKKAERIYVKRLGFEPPPVTEQRRYQGDLSEILSYQQRQFVALTINEQDSALFVLNLLKTQSNAKQLNEKQLQHIQQVKRQLMAKVQKEQDIIRQVATLERIQLAQSLQLDNCERCVDELYNVVWRTLPAPVALPVQRQEDYSDVQPSVIQFSQRVEAIKQNRMSKERVGGTP